MIRSLADRGVRGVVLDIEGTTTPIAFVHDVLFGYARTRLGAALAAPSDDPRWAGAIAALQAEQAIDDAAGGLTAYAERLMAEDRKSPGLKQLQGLIWEQGYREGALRGEVFADVAPALAAWHDAGLDLAIFSSGSVLAQRLLFSTTSSGDLTRYISRYFDTSIGPKQSPESYRRIADAMQHPIGALLFISDVVGELDAARTAGVQVLLCVRPGNAPQPASELDVIREFRGI